MVDILSLFENTKDTSTHLSYKYQSHYTSGNGYFKFKATTYQEMAILNYKATTYQEMAFLRK
jgi:hypothetical protein